MGDGGCWVGNNGFAQKSSLCPQVSSCRSSAALSYPRCGLSPGREERWTETLLKASLWMWDDNWEKFKCKYLMNSREGTFDLWGLLMWSSYSKNKFSLLKQVLSWNTMENSSLLASDRQNKLTDLVFIFCSEAPRKAQDSSVASGHVPPKEQFL